MEILFINSILFTLPLIIILIILNIIYRKCFKNNNKKSIIITLIAPLIILVFIIPTIHILGNTFFSIKEKINKTVMEDVITKGNQIEIMADDLINNFIKSSIDSDSIYTNKILQIKGVIDYIGIPKDNPPIKDNSYITFSYFDNIIICYFTNNEIIPDLKFDQRDENKSITIIGKYRNYKIYENEIRIEIGDCEVIEYN
jgi:hypothetical protein